MSTPSYNQLDDIAKHLDELKKAAESAHKALEFANKQIEQIKRSEGSKSVPKEREEDTKKEPEDLQNKLYKQGKSFLKAQVRSQGLGALENFQNSPTYNKLLEKFTTAIIPLPMALMNIGLAFKESLSDSQKEELRKMAEKIFDITLDMVFRDKGIKEGLDAIISVVKEIGAFFQKNPEIALKTGANFLKRMNPMAEFVEVAAKEIAKLDIKKVTQNLPDTLFRGLKLLTDNFMSLGNIIEQAAEKGAKSEMNVGRRPDPFHR